MALYGLPGSIGARKCPDPSRVHGSVADVKTPKSVPGVTPLVPQPNMFPSSAAPTFARVRRWP